MSEILFADDDEGLRTMVADVLRAAGHEVRLAENGARALLEVRRAEPDLVILDYRMGTPNGFEVCRNLKEDPRLAHLPVLILTAESDIENRLGGFEAGADDYLAKPFDPRELNARVSALLRGARLALDRNPTSGLPGGDAIQREIERRRALGGGFALCYFDLDNFKPFADRFGFAVADEAIREAGRAVAAATADGGGFVGHVGGDDFVIVCGPGDAHARVRAAQSLFAAGLLHHVPEEVARTGGYRAVDRAGVERDFPLTRLSAAIVRVDPERWTSLEQLGEVAAQAKRRAKSADGIAEAEL